MKEDSFINKMFMYGGIFTLGVIAAIYGLATSLDSPNVSSLMLTAGGSILIVLGAISYFREDSKMVEELRR